MPYTHNPAWHPAPPDPSGLLNASDCAIALLDVGGTLVWQNEAFTQSIGLPLHDAEGRHLAALLSGPGTNLALPLWIAQQLADGRGVDRLEFVGRRHDGRELCCRLTITPFNAGLSFVVTMTDAAAAIHYAREAERLAELLETVQQLAGIGLWERDAASLDGRWDRHMFRLVGLPQAAQPPRIHRALRHTHPDDNAAAAFLASLATPGDYSARFRHLKDDGTVRHLHSQWRVPGGEGAGRVVGILRDVTDSAELVRSFEDANTHLSLAVELGRIAMWRHDLQTEQVECNDVLSNIVGIPADACSFHHGRWLAIVHPEDLGKVEADLSAARLGTPTNLQARYRGPAGDWRYVMTRRVAQRDHHGQPVALLGVAFDVTDQAVDAQRALDLAHTLEAAARATGIGICAVERSASGRRGWTVSWNTQMQSLFGCPPGAPPPMSLGRWIRRCVHPNDAARVHDSLRRWLRQPTAPVEVEFRAADAQGRGAVRWLSLRGDAGAPSGAPARIFCVVMDTTERHQSLQRLQAAVERAELATRGVGIGTWERLADGTVLWDEQMFRLRDMQAAPRAPDEPARVAIVHPDDREAIRSFHLPSSGAAMSPTYEFRIVLPDGRIRWLASRSTPILGPHGAEVRRIGVNWDITDNKNTELAQRERELARRESQAKSRLLARISHELRTPLNAVLGVTQLMLMGGQPPDPALQRRQLEQIQAASRHLLALIDGVLDLSAYEGGEMKPDLQAVDLQAVVAQSLPLVESAAAARRIGLATALRAASMPWADPTRLRQVLVNLLSNAVKYNRDGGRVRVESRDEDGHVVLAVADTGHGIEPGQRQHLFQPFNRLGREHEGIEGTGIGLAIVKTLAEGMGGRIEVDSEPGRGSRFEVWLRCAEDMLDSASARLQAPHPGGRLAPLRSDGRGRVLYIEDNPVNAMIVQAAVAQRPGIVLAVATDGATGVARAAELQPHLVLLDMQLPDADGHEVLRQLRADPRTAGMPCIALSANVLPDDIAQALAAGFADYWTKPIDLQAFLAALDALFGAPRPAAQASALAPRDPR
ncbi:PAS domain-containing protein [Aquincola sp. MAHUQ-54]|uniref:histidine kinase n=1 Tax=Aquincola agrisoli TaxID=3119538 RepID=A0AAW9Q9Q9_9BURK